MNPQVAFIIVSYNTCGLLANCLASIYKCTQGVSFEVVVVDNQSADDSVQIVARDFPSARLVLNSNNVCFGVANNQGVEASAADFIFLLNSDASLEQDTATRLVEFLHTHPHAGIVGPAVILKDGQRQPKTCGLLPSSRVMLNQNLLLCRLFPRSRLFAGLYTEWTDTRELKLGWVSGVCMLIRREVYTKTKGFDPEIFMYAEDVDLCRRAVAHGWEIWRVNDYAIRHLCGGSTKTPEQALRNRVLQQRNFLRLLNKSTGLFGRWITKTGLAFGLFIRCIVRTIAAGVGMYEQRLFLKADLRCLIDLLGFQTNISGGQNAHRN